MHVLTILTTLQITNIPNSILQQFYNRDILRQINVQLQLQQKPQVVSYYQAKTSTVKGISIKDHQTLVVRQQNGSRHVFVQKIFFFEDCIFLLVRFILLIYLTGV